MFEVYSSPIIVVSKQEQIRNRITEIQERKQGYKNPKSKKRVRTEEVASVLEMIVANQSEQTSFLKKLLGQNNIMKKEELNNSKKRDREDTPLSLEQSFSAFLEAMEREIPGERPKKLRRLLNSDRPGVSAFMSALETHQNTPSSPQSNGSPTYEEDFVIDEVSDLIQTPDIDEQISMVFSSDGEYAPSEGEFNHEETNPFEVF